MQTRTASKKFRSHTIRKRTPAQIAAMQRLNESNWFPGTRDKEGELVTPAQTSSSGSWWVGRSRAEFNQQLAIERPRLRQATLGRSAGKYLE